MTVLFLLQVMKINMRKSNQKKDVCAHENEKKGKERSRGCKRTLTKVDKALENDPTEKLLKVFEQENERARQHALKLFSMLFGQQNRVAATATELQNQMRVPTHATNMGMEWPGGFCQSTMQPYVVPGNIQ